MYGIHTAFVQGGNFNGYRSQIFILALVKNERKE